MSGFERNAIEMIIIKRKLAKFVKYKPFVEEDSLSGK